MKNTSNNKAISAVKMPVRSGFKRAKTYPPAIDYICEHNKTISYKEFMRSRLPEKECPRSETELISMLYKAEQSLAIKLNFSLWGKKKNRTNLEKIKWWIKNGSSEMTKKTPAS